MSFHISVPMKKTVTTGLYLSAQGLLCPSPLDYTRTKWHFRVIGSFNLVCFGEFFCSSYTISYSQQSTGVQLFPHLWKYNFCLFKKNSICANAFVVLICVFLMISVSANYISSLQNSYSCLFAAPSPLFPLFMTVSCTHTVCCDYVHPVTSCYLLGALLLSPEPLLLTCDFIISQWLHD